MFGSRSRAAATAALMFTLTACSEPAPDTGPQFTVPEPMSTDPEGVAQEAEYRKHFDAGRQALDAKDAPAAITHLERAVAASPKGVDGQLALAAAYTATKAPEKAIAAYGAALAVNPRLPDAALERAALLERAGRLEDCFAQYTQLIGQEISRELTARAYWLRSDVADRLGKRSDYRYDREQAMKLDPAYAARVTGGDVLVSNHTDDVLVVTLDRVVSPDGTARAFPPGFKFTIPAQDSAYLLEKDRPIAARSVWVTIRARAQTKSFTATYEKGMSLEVHLFSEQFPGR